MSKEIRALRISISAKLIEELLGRYVKNAPEDLKVESVDYSWGSQNLDFCFTSREFPIARGGFRENTATGKISVYKNADRTTTVMLQWKDPDKKGG